MWQKIRNWFYDSETIVWARLQMLGGAIMAVFSTMNFMTFFDNSLTKLQQFTIFSLLFIQGLITEVLRRLRTDTPPPPAA